MIIRSSLLVAIGAAAGAATALLLRSLIEQHRSTLVMSPLATKGAQTTATKGATEPSADTNKSLRIPAFRLREFATAVLVSCNVEPVDATKAAAILILADERGIDSHGIARLKAYFNLLRSGDLNPRPVVRVVSETASTATVDGDNGLVSWPGFRSHLVVPALHMQHVCALTGHPCCICHARKSSS